MLEQAKATPQEPRYHGEGDVWTHTCMVVDALLQSADYLAATPDERGVLFFAALLHDVAKHRTTVVDPMTGRIGQPGHSRKGAVDVRILLWEAGAPFALREAVCRLIAVHQVPFYCLEDARRPVSPAWTVHELSWQLDIRLLAALAEADMRGASAPTRRACWTASSCSASWRARKAAMAHPGLRRRAHAAELFPWRRRASGLSAVPDARLEGDADVRPAGIG